VNLKRLLHKLLIKSFPKLFPPPETFWTVKHPVSVYDKKTNAEEPLEEFRKVRRLLQNDRKRDYPDSNIEFGDFTYGNPKIWNWDKNLKCIIGKYCSIAFGTTILIGGEHRYDWLSTYPFSAYINFFSNSINENTSVEGDIIIGNDVWIGSDVKILSNVVIGNGAVIGANSLVKKGSVIPDYTIWAGVPAKQIKKRFSDDTIEKLLRIKWWDWSDEDILKVIPILQSGDILSLINYYKNIRQ